MRTLVADCASVGVPSVIENLIFPLSGEEPLSPEARADAHLLRAESDAVLVGAGTVRADDPALTVRDLPPPWDGRPRKADPLRVVLGRAAPEARIRPCLERSGPLPPLLDELGGAADEDRYVDQHFQLDLSAKFRVTRDIRLFAEWINVTDAPYFAYQNFAGAKRILQYEKYSWTAKFGVAASF